MPFLHESDEEWHEPPGHSGAFSRYLVHSQQFDFRTSRYPHGGYVEAHVHEVAEQVYYFLRGAGTAECGDETRTVGPGDVMYVPAGVRHSLVSTGTEDLEFVLATSPPDIPR